MSLPLEAVYLLYFAPGGSHSWTASASTLAVLLLGGIVALTSPAVCTALLGPDHDPAVAWLCCMGSWLFVALGARQSCQHRSLKSGIMLWITVAMLPLAIVNFALAVGVLAVVVPLLLPMQPCSARGKSAPERRSCTDGALCVSVARLVQLSALVLLSPPSVLAALSWLAPRFWPQWTGPVPPAEDSFQLARSLLEQAYTELGAWGMPHGPAEASGTLLLLGAGGMVYLPAYFAAVALVVFGSEHT